MSSTGNHDFKNMELNNFRDVSEGRNLDFSDVSFNGLDSFVIDFFAIPGPRTGEQGTEVKSALGPSRPTSFPLLKLPPELRLLIYGLLIATGDLNIMRTTKFIHKEAANVLKKNAVLRMNFGSGNRTSSGSFPITASLNLTGMLAYHASSIVQRIECCFHMGAARETLLYFDVYTKIIRSFGGKAVARESCTIFLDLGVCDDVPYWYDHRRETTWQAVTELTGFKTLVLKIRRDRDYDFEERYFRQFGRLFYHTEDSCFHRYLLEDYEMVRHTLERTLGPAALDKSVGGHCLRFHPSDFKLE